MNGDGQIQAYLDEVRSSLHGPPWQRRRILEEIEDHLHDGTTELMREGADRQEAVTKVMDDLGPPAVVAASFASSDQSTPKKTGLLRWLPMVIPLAICVLAVAYLLRAITWIPGEWTDGERSTQLAYLRRAVTTGLLSFAAWFCIRRGDRDPWWWWFAWLPAATAVAISL